MLAKALMSFQFEDLKKSKNEVFEIENPQVFLDLYNAKFVEQVDRLHTEN